MPGNLMCTPPSGGGSRVVEIADVRIRPTRATPQYTFPAFIKEPEQYHFYLINRGIPYMNAFGTVKQRGRIALTVPAPGLA